MKNKSPKKYPQNQKQDRQITETKIQRKTLISIKKNKK